LPTYAYSALTQAGRKSQGTIAAATSRDAIRRLASQGEAVLEIAEEQAAPAPFLSGFGRGGRVVRLAVFTRQLAAMAGSGVPLMQSLGVMIEQTRDPRVLRVLSDVRRSVESGTTLAEALARHPRVFPRVMVGMVQAGEKGGTLEAVLDQLSELYEREDALREEVRAAMAYPILVLSLGVISAVLLLAFVIPRLRQLFEDVGQALPLPTRLLLWLSNLVTSYGWLLALAAAAGLVALRLAPRSPRIRLFLDRCALRAPLFGRLVRNVAIARFTRLLGTLTQGGVGIVESMEVVQPALTNRVISEAVSTMTQRVRTGEGLAAVMKQSGVFPPMPIQMVAVGEESGHLDQMLLRAAAAFEREVSGDTRVMTSLLAPVMILIVAGMVGFIILSVLLPVFRLSSVIG
jgi:general secretion pathway protein F